MYHIYDHEFKGLFETPVTNSCLNIEGHNYISSIAFPKELGEGIIHDFNLGKGIFLTFEQIRANRDLMIHHSTIMPDYILGSYYINNGFEMNFNNHKMALSKEICDISWSRTPGDTYHTFSRKGCLSKSCFIVIRPEYFSSIQENSNNEENPLWNILSGTTLGVCTAGQVSYDDLILVRDLLIQKPEKPWEWLNVEGKILQLVGNCLERFEREFRSANRIDIHPSDIKKIRIAHDILIERMNNPPSIVSLAKLSGLNEFKLKKGFKQLYSNTIYGYLKQCRLKKAYNLLKKGNMNVSEVAMKIGYSSFGSFSTTFKKEFGIKPVECLKKYY